MPLLADSVVVGASDTALSFLETLLTVPYLSFTNLYLLAPMAAERLRTPRGAPPDAAADAATGGGGDAGAAFAPFLSHTCGYSTEELQQLAIGARVRLVESRMVGIERARKAVVLPDDSILPYDYLVVAPELGDQTLLPLGPEAAQVPPRAVHPHPDPKPDTQPSSQRAPSLRPPLPPELPARAPSSGPAPNPRAPRLAGARRLLAVR